MRTRGRGRALQKIYNINTVCDVEKSVSKKSKQSATLREERAREPHFASLLLAVQLLSPRERERDQIAPVTFRNELPLDFLLLLLFLLLLYNHLNNEIRDLGSERVV